MAIGIDFDNTLVSYEQVFRDVALEQGLVDETVPAGKTAVRDHLRAQGREAAWTELQGLVYGARMAGAAPFPGAKEFLRRCAESGTTVYVVSHRTRHPYGGPAYDLHRAAREWLAANGFHDPRGGALPESHVFFEESKAEKVARIAERSCTAFVDDLPEIFREQGFPGSVRKLLFDPAGQYDEAECAGACRVRTWREIHDRLLGGGD